MKLYKSLFIVAAITCGMMTSCSEDGYWDKATPAALGLTDGTSYAFDSKSLSYVYYPADALNGTDINVTITRGDASKDFTLPIKAVFSDSTLISGPESVTFTAGQNTAVYPIHFIREIEIGEAVTAKLAIDTASVGIPRVEMPAELDSLATAADSAKYKADSTAYEIYQTKLANYKLATTVSIMKDYNWTPLGKGTIYETFWFASDDDPVAEASVTIMQAVENNKIFRVVDPWSGLADYAGAKLNGNQMNIQFRLLEVGETLDDVTITQKDLVYYDRSNTGYHHPSYDADVWILHPAEFTNTATEDNWLHNKVLSYQENGLPAIVQLAPRYYMFGVGGWNNSQSDDIVKIVFPGVKVYDYSAEVSYVGMFTNPDGAISVWGDLTLGDDAKTAKAVIISQDADPAAVADAIAAGELEATDVEAGRIELPMPEDANGKLQIVVAVIDEDEAKNVATAKFEYYSGKNPWTSLGMGQLTDNLFITMYSPDGVSSYDPQTYEVEILESTEEPGLFRLVDPFGRYAKSFKYDDYTTTYFEINATDPEGVYIPLQETGIDDGDGMTYLASYGGYMLQKYEFAELKSDGYFGTLVDGVITLPSFSVKDDDGNVKYTFQGIFAQGKNAWYAGQNTEFKLVLPTASAAARAKAKKAAAASDFARRLSGKVYISSTRVMKPVGFKMMGKEKQNLFSRELIK